MFTQITVQGYYKSCNEYGKTDGDIIRFIENDTAIQINDTLAYWLDSTGERWYFIPVRIDDSEFTNVPVQSEAGNILLELGCLLPVVAVVVIGAIAILSGDTTMLDLYNAIGDLFVTIGAFFGM